MVDIFEVRSSNQRPYPQSARRLFLAGFGTAFLDQTAEGVLCSLTAENAFPPRVLLCSLIFCPMEYCNSAAII